MKFFIDYENVHTMGFKGAEFLAPEDEVILFFSQACEKIENGILNKLYSSRCGFRIYRLPRPGKNALDFCIISDIADTLSNKFEGNIGIVSRDKDYRIFRDYWQVRKPAMRIVCAPDIAQCILATGETTEKRWQAAHIEYEKVYIEEQYTQMKKRRILQIALEQELEGRKLDFAELTKSLLNKKAGRETYLKLMSQYGIMDGQDIYRVLKKATQSR